ncbi:hypothetical protein PIB30_016305 [Stylosanthes scabra]|uniref:Uncharacterized protein n=1 Tax=Stylosanthes scabra TaxID=79078 RepID=A0ABU6R7K2_9FABA|nr:hypothetical protein [Stylosanthes scabra]
MRKRRKTKKNVKQGHWCGRTLMVAWPHDLRLAKFIITGATSRSPHLNGAPAHLVRPRNGLGAPATQVCGTFAPPSWRARGHAFARWPWRVRALALGALGPTTGRTTRPRPSDRAPARAH